MRPAGRPAAVRAVLFDLDGTLLDTAPDMVGALNSLRASENLPPIEFATARAESLRELHAIGLTPTDLARTGRHPEFGVVTLRQHLATWVAHDQTHAMQIARIFGRSLAADVGPWRAYLRAARPPG